MPSTEHLLQDLAIALMAAGAAALLFHRLRLPMIAGYLLAGLLVGPELTPQLVSDSATIRLLSELGVILLMFSLGLDFRLRHLARAASSAGVVALVELTLMFALGYGAGQLAGWTPAQSLFAGAVVSISSTMIVARTFREEGIGGKVREIVLGTLIFEDLAAILMIAVLTAVASGDQVSGHSMWLLLARLALVLAGFLVLGMLVVPRLVRRVVALRHDEMLVVAAVGLCFGFAWLAQLAGFSVALGGFLAGALAAESGLGKVLEAKIGPLRDVFAALFFVAVGMQLKPGLLVQHWGVIVGFTLLVLVGKTVGVATGTFLAGRGIRESVQAGLSLAQIGEFSFIIAGVGVHLGAAPALLASVAVTVSVITALVSSVLIRRSTSVAGWVDRRLPHSVQTFVTLYGAWVESLRSAPKQATAWQRTRPAIAWLLIDALVIGGVVAAGAFLRAPLAALVGRLGISPEVADWAVTGVVAGAVAPFLFGIVRMASKIARTLALIAVPLPPRGRADNGRAPRRALSAAIELTIVLVVGIPLMLVTQPFMSGLAGLALLVAVLLVLAIAFWRSANDLLGHMQAGAELVVATLAKESHRETGRFQVVREILPGLGDFEPLHVAEGSEAAGRTLGELNLRGRTGASVVAILRGEERIASPTAEERLRPGDFVALTGSHAALAAARPLLSGAAEAPSSHGARL